MHDDEDSRWLRRALELAEGGRRTVAPNPLVGCVLVDRAGTVVGQGCHVRAGEPHAEALALAAAGDRAAGATAYVTLEPCAHYGRTPPCADALLAAGVTRVVYAVADPHAVAAGGGARLRTAGVAVTAGVHEAAARRQNEVFLHTAATGRPFVICKVAVSLDGRTAAADGTSQWLTGAGARRRVHLLRAEVGAILVGSGTVLADDPRLTVRLDGEPPPARQPLRVVLDRRGRTAGGGYAVDDTAGHTLRLAAPDVDAALAVLTDRGITSVLVEGGAEVLSAFLAAGRCDKLVVHVAPLLLGEKGRPAVLGGPASMAEAGRWRLDAVDVTGDDTILTLYPGGR